MTTVTAVWAIFLCAAALAHADVPAVVWGVPGFTYAALVGGIGDLAKLAGKRKLTVSLDKDEPDK